MLTREQHEEFEARGFVRLAGAFDTADARAMEACVWSSLARRYGVDRDDRSTWGVPLVSGLQGLKKHRVFEGIGTAAVRGAFDSLLGEGAWIEPKDWGQFLVDLPPASPAPFRVPHRVWHTDFAFAGPTSYVHGLIVFCFLSRVPEGHGGTLVVEGSPAVVRRFVASRPQAIHEKMKVTRQALLHSDPWLAALASEKHSGDRVREFMQEGGRIGDVGVRVVELTGEPGDVVIGHSWLLHAGSPHCGKEPRIMRVQRVRARGRRQGEPL